MGELGIFAVEAVLNLYCSKIKDFFFSVSFCKKERMLSIYFSLSRGCKSAGAKPTIEQSEFTPALLR